MKTDRLNKREKGIVAAWANENSELYEVLKDQAIESPGANSCHVNRMLLNAGHDLKLETAPITLRDLMMYIRGECVVG